MLWKVLSIVAALCLGAGAWFANINKAEHAEERALSARAKDHLKTTLAEIETVTKVKETRDEELKTEQKKRDDVIEEGKKVAADTASKEAEVELLKKSYEEVTKQLTQLEDQIKKAGDIKKLMAQVDELKKQQAATEAAISNQNQQLAFADEKIQKVNGEITHQSEVQKRQRAGVVEPGFTARVSTPFNEFGFVILNKGNLGGMFANAMLDVKRGRQVVARLKVRDVEQGSSVADLIPGTLAPGVSLRSGDMVVAAAAAAVTSVAPTTPAPGAVPGAPAPATMAAPGADPFGAAPAGGMAAPAMAPAGADPFGGAPAGGMAPAPAPAAPAGGMAPAGADPFAPAPAGGMAPAPAAPAGGMAPAGADPFAPAPAGGMAPAPAAPAGGMAPAGADPFAPAPPK